jgi:hypothetical protein
MTLWKKKIPAQHTNTAQFPGWKCPKLLRSVMNRFRFDCTSEPFVVNSERLNLSARPSYCFQRPETSDGGRNPLSRRDPITNVGSADLHLLPDNIYTRCAAGTATIRSIERWRQSRPPGPRTPGKTEVFIWPGYCG